MVLALAFLCGSLHAQDVQLRIYSEFQRVDPFGKILDRDRAERPREILSPAVARNGYFSFHVALTAPAKSLYFLAVQMYPPKAFPWKLYEEKFVSDGKQWIPDTLKDLDAPYFGMIPDPDQNIPGQTTCVYLLDVWVPKETPVSGVRLEMLAKLDYWRMSPMELRVPGATIADLSGAPFLGLLPKVTEPADAAARVVFEAYQAGRTETTAGPPRNVRSVIWRNAVQDAALAGKLEGQVGKGALKKRLSDAPAAMGAERYLRVRDLLIKEGSRVAE